MNRLADAASPYLLSHADNPVDWYPWGRAAFAAAAERDVPVLVSVGYATCHWCHVMAQESFGDPVLAAELNARFVAVKVDREEHPQVDAAMLAAAGAFTPNLGWPLNVFLTPDGRAFHAGTYSPPVPRAGHTSFRQVLDAVTEAWTERRADVESSASGLSAAIRAADAAAVASPVTDADLAAVTDGLLGYEDRTHGGFGGAPKFPVAPVLLAALELAELPGLHAARRTAVRGLVERTFAAIRDGGLRDPVEGGFFRYAVRRDWTEPHYERMLTDNALLLRLAAALGDRPTAAGIVSFLHDVLLRPSGGFGSAQDSESVIDGRRSEGGYYALDAVGRAEQPPPAVDGKVLAGWNGIAIGALATAGVRFAEPGWIRSAAGAADAVLAGHLQGGRLVRATLDGRASEAAATLEDYGGLACGLIDAGLATGRVDLVDAARRLVDACRAGGALVAPSGDETLTALDIPGQQEGSEGAVPSGATLAATAAWQLYLLTGDAAYRDASEATVAPLARAGVDRPLAAGAALGLAVRQRVPVVQLVVVAEAPGDPLAVAARAQPASVVAVVDEPTARAFAAAGYELFAGRTTHHGAAAAYRCEDFVCRLPVTDPAALGAPAVG